MRSFPKELLAHVGPKFLKDVEAGIAADIQSPLIHHGVGVPAGVRIISRRDTGSNSIANDLREVKLPRSGIAARNNHAGRGVSHPFPEPILRPHSKIARVL